MTLRIPLVSAFLLSASFAFAADAPVVIPLWPNGAPGFENRKDEKEVYEKGNLTNIHNPSLTAYLPAKEKSTGAAVVICPGGGHARLAIDHEGHNVAKWLADRGVAGIILKYRLGKDKDSPYKAEVHAVADGQRAIRLARSKAKEWNLNEKAIGIIGFSAGGTPVNAAAAHSDAGKPDAADPIERFTSRPDFQALVYTRGDAPEKGMPPLFIVCGGNDRVAEGMIELYGAYKKAGVPAEIHIYAGAGHGFGLRATEKTSAREWPNAFETWLAAGGFLRKP